MQRNPLLYSVSGTQHLHVDWPCCSAWLPAEYCGSLSITAPVASCAHASRQVARLTCSLYVCALPLACLRDTWANHLCSLIHGEVVCVPPWYMHACIPLTGRCVHVVACSIISAYVLAHHTGGNDIAAAQVTAHPPWPIVGIQPVVYSWWTMPAIENAGHSVHSLANGMCQALMSSMRVCYMAHLLVGRGVQGGEHASDSHAHPVAHRLSTSQNCVHTLAQFVPAFSSTVDQTTMPTGGHYHACGYIALDSHAVPTLPACKRAICPAVHLRWNTDSKHAM